MTTKRRRPWAEQGLSYSEWCMMKAEETAPKRRWAPWDALAPRSDAKPPLCALVETDETGRKVIRLSDGFPVRRSSYGRIRLEQRSTGESK